MHLHLTSAFSEFGAQPIPLNADPEPTERRGVIDVSTVQRILHATRHDTAAVLGTLSEQASDHPSFYCPLAAFTVGTLTSTWLVDNWNGQVDAFVQAHDRDGTLWVVSSTALADLRDPRPLLGALKRACLARSGTILFVYSADSGMFRHWTEDAFIRFLAAGGFPVRPDEAGDPSWMIATLTQEAYGDYLNRLNLDPQLIDADWLLLTTEDAGLAPTGGIGTYTRNIKLLDRRVAVLRADPHVRTDELDPRSLAPADLADVSPENYHLGTHPIEVLRNALYLLPNIALVEAQDYQSIFFRLVQAKRTAQLPHWLHLRVFMHGAIDHIKYGAADDSAQNYTPFEASLAIRDSYIFKYADSCYAPSRYLGQDLMQEEFGYEVAHQSIVRLPFDLSLLPPARPLQLDPITHIAFIGKYSPLKGWPDFVRAIGILTSRGALAPIQELISLAPGTPPSEDAEKLSGACPYRPLHLSHQELLDFVDQHRNDTLFVVPCGSESFSYVVLEQLLLGTRLVAYNKGGVIEVVDDADYVARFFCGPDPSALAGKIEELLHAPPSHHQTVIEQTRTRIRGRQLALNIWWSRRDSPFLKPDLSRSVELPSPDVSVITCVHNTPFNSLDHLLQSIGRSRLRPAEVILVDAGSTDAYLENLRSWAAEGTYSELPLRLHLTAEPAGPRDAGLRLTRSEFAYFADAQTSLLPGTLEDCWAALATDPELVAVTGIAIDGLLPLAGSFVSGNASEIPLGIPEARMLALTENPYPSAQVMVRTQSLRQDGGWDDADPAAWDEWSFFTRLAWAGHRFSIIPAPGHTTPPPSPMFFDSSSTVRRRRRVRSLVGMSRLDAAILLSLADRGNTAAPTVSCPPEPVRAEESEPVRTDDAEPVPSTPTPRILPERPWAHRWMLRIAYRSASTLHRLWRTR